MNIPANSKKVKDRLSNENNNWSLRLLFLIIIFQFVQINIFSIEKHTIMVVVHENGQVTYNDKVYRNESFTFELSEVETTQIIVTPDEGYTPRTRDSGGSGHEWGDKRCAPMTITVSVTSSDKTIDAYFDEIPDAFPKHRIIQVSHVKK